MLNRRALVILRMKSLLPTTVRTLALLASAVLYVLAWLFAGSTGAWLVLACNLVLAVLAWPAYSTLGGWVRWSRQRWRQRVGMLALYLLGYVVPPIVIVRGLQQAWRARQAAIAERPGQIARMEKDMGL
jgi:hypothetical protein